ncbi:hypothetical protein V5R04_06790 [Jonesiaceae bacterium BS-20]|uniref:Uncharacterized protein n=1 Tax=Jonesiaceae bacterium BS-20 TaxID=3120821 RepID=A0AAU7DYZ3_9MICO
MTTIITTQLQLGALPAGSVILGPTSDMYQRINQHWYKAGQAEHATTVALPAVLLHNPQGQDSPVSQAQGPGCDDSTYQSIPTAHLTAFDRIEVIDHRGGRFVRHLNEGEIAQMSEQDHGRTLKLFVEPKALP